MFAVEVGIPRRFIVFISSTSKDLAEHRRVVHEQCKEYGCDVNAMEEFGARDRTSVEISLKQIESCDVFVGIYARRYGYVPPGSENFITEMEYDEARRLNKPRLVFVVKPEFKGHPLLEEFCDITDPQIGGRFDAFLTRVGQERVWDTFTSPDDLAGRVLGGISKWEGWRAAQPLPSGRRFIGREELVNELKTFLDEHHSCALIGMGGIGKSLTAERLCVEMRERFEGGVLWATLGPEAREADVALDAVMREWSCCHPDGRLVSPEKLNPSRLKDFLAEAPGPLLMVLDDVWHPKPAQELLWLLPRTAALLVTTRRAEIARQLDVERHVQLDQLSDAEGLSMLQDRLGDIPSPPALREIVSVLSGHPLALEIAAAQIESTGPDTAEELPGQLRKVLSDGSDLSALEIDDDFSSGSVEAALALSYDSMNSDLKRRFRALGVMAPDLDISPVLMAVTWSEQMTDIVSFDEIYESHADEMLTDALDRMNVLANNGVLDRLPEQRVFLMHGLLRAYARGLLTRAGEFDTVFFRYYWKVLTFAWTGSDVLSQLKASGAWKRRRIYFPHINYLGNQAIEALEGALGSLEPLAQSEPAVAAPNSDSTEIRKRCETVLEFVETAWPYIEHHPQLKETSLRWLQGGLAASRTVNDSRKCMISLSRLATWHLQHGQRSEALSYLAASLSLARQAHDDGAISSTLAEISQIYAAQGDLPKAKTALREAEAIRGSSTPGSADIEMKLTRAGICRAEGRLQEALDLYMGALAAVESSTLGGTSFHKGPIWNGIGLVLRGLGQPHKALEYLEQAHRQHEFKDERASDASVLGNMAACFEDIGERQRALALYQQVVSMRRELGDELGEANALNNLGTSLTSLGQKQEALACFEQALPVLREASARGAVAACLTNIGGICISLGNNERAAELAKEALAINRDIGDRIGQAKVLNFLGDLNVGRNYIEAFIEAAKLYTEALGLCEQTGDRREQAQTLQNLGIVYQKLDLLEPALKFYSSALGLMREVRNQTGEQVTLANIGGLAIRAGDFGQGFDFNRQALRLAREVQDSVGESTILSQREQMLDYLKANNIAALPEWLE